MPTEIIEIECSVRYYYRKLLNNRYTVFKVTEPIHKLIGPEKVEDWGTEEEASKRVKDLMDGSIE